MVALESRVALQSRPVGRAVMYHEWRHLTFLHWRVEAEPLQRLLPPGLTIDTHEGRAYVGLVPFTMCGIRLRGLPCLHGLSASHETNLRTYVVDGSGVPGVWFFSLDADNAAFVHTARAWYRLNYVRARMEVAAAGGEVRYRSQRTWPVAGAECDVAGAVEGTPSVATPGSLPFFLVERYVLFAYARGRLYSGRVWHEPYTLQPFRVGSVKETVSKVAQISLPEDEPVSFYSTGVDVDVFGLRRV